MSDAPVAFIKKKGRARQANARQRQQEAAPAVASPAAAGTDDGVDSRGAAAATPASEQPLESSVKRPSKRRNVGALGAQSAGYKSKRSKVDSDSESEDDASLGVAAKEFRVNFSTSTAANATGQSEEVRTGDDAARITDLLEKDDGLYHGSKSYKSQLPMGSSKYGAVAGPSNVRTITITDYQPDVCKDYKETGFCGFGDTCKFLHDRGDYLQGWQLDNIYLSQRPEAAAPEAEEEEEEELPFACLICRKPFKDPVVTRCGHYFCSSCAIARFAKTPKCYACGAPTGGLFNKAEKILEKKRKAQEARMEARQAEMGDFDEQGDEGVELEGVEDQGEVPEAEQRVTGGGVQEDSGSEREFYESE